MDTMDEGWSGMGEIEQGTQRFEHLANIGICKDRLKPHLSSKMRERRFREAFGVSAEIAFLLWTVLDAYNEGPPGGQPIHLLWTLLLLKTYGTQVDLAGRCGVDVNTYRVWTRLFLAKLAAMDVVSEVFAFFGLA